MTKSVTGTPGRVFGDVERGDMWRRELGDMWGRDVGDAGTCVWGRGNVRLGAWGCKNGDEGTWIGKLGDVLARLVA